MPDDAAGDDLARDPVVTASLRVDGTSLARLDWQPDDVPDGAGRQVETAHHRGTCNLTLKRHEGEGAPWFATAQYRGAVSYHAKRGRRTITLRRIMPAAAAAALVGRRASALCDMPGLDDLIVTKVADHATGHTVHLEPLP